MKCSGTIVVMDRVSVSLSSSRMNTLVLLILHLTLCFQSGSAFFATKLKPVIERDDVREVTTSKSVGTLIKWFNHNMEDKFDQMSKKMNNVNRNVETLKQDFETLSMKENRVEQKIDTLESRVRHEISTVEGGTNKTLDVVEEELRAREPIASGVERKFDDVVACLGGKLSKKFFFVFNILWLPAVAFASRLLEPVVIAARSSMG